MRKFFLILFVLPALAALGHDIYVFIQAPENGFRFSDVGALWDKYHKESHDQWKIKVREFTETVDSVNPLAGKSFTGASETTEGDSPPFAEGFTQATDYTGRNEVNDALEEEVIKKQPSQLQKAIGFTLEQPAILVFGILAVILILLDAVRHKASNDSGNMKKMANHKKMKKLKKMKKQR